MFTLIVLTTGGKASSLNTNLSVVYAFNETSGNLTNWIGLNYWSGNLTDGITQGITDCVNGLCYNCTGANAEKITLPDDFCELVDGSEDYTMNFWSNTTHTGLKYIFAIDYCENHFNVVLDGATNDILLYTAGLYRITAVDEYYPGLRNMITVTYNKYAASDNYKLYVDNILEGGYTDNDIRSGGLQDNSLFGNAYTESVTGRLDEFYIWSNRTLTQTEVTELWNNSFGKFYPFGVTEEGDISINITYPTASQRINEHFWINVTTNISSACIINNTNWIINTTNIDNTTFGFFRNVASLSDGDYSIRINCTNASWMVNATATRSFTIDTAAPTMTINNGTNGNFFRPDNRTALSNTSAQTAIFNITFNDALALYGFEVNMTNSSGNLIYNYTTISLSGFEYNWTQSVDLSHAKGGNMTVNITVWDGHTAMAIDDMDIKKGLNYLRFDNEIKVIAEGAWTADTTKEHDRYTFKFSYPPIISPDKKVFYVESDGKLDYLPDSNFKAHFIDWKNKKWIDFEGSGGKATVTRINDYRYMVGIEAKGNSVIFSSIGGLNSRSKIYKFVIDNTPPVLNWFKPTSAIVDIPSNDSIVIKINVTDAYRNTTQFYLYNSTRHRVNNTNITAAGSGWHIYNLTYLNLTDETYYINATHLDYYDNIGYSSTYTLSDNFLDNCSTANMQTINFSILNATNDKYIIGTSEFLFRYNRTDSAGENTFKNYSSQMVHSNFSFCISPNETSYTSDISISYVVGLISYTYFTSAIQLTNITQHINLYTQDDPARITFRVTDYDESPVEGAYIKVMKWDIGDNSFKTTEILKTDSQGYTLGNLVLYTAWYKFAIDYQGVTYLVTEPEKIFETTRTFRIDFETDWYDTYDTSTGISTTLEFNNVTNNFKYEWNTHTGAAREGCLKVVRRNITKDTLLVDNCTSSTAGERIYTIQDTTATYLATGYLKFNTKPRTIVTDVLDYIGKSAWKIYDTTGGKRIGIFAGFMITLSLAFIGIWSPISSIVLLLLGVIASSLFGLYKIALGATMVLIVMGGILIWKLSRK